MPTAPSVTIHYIVPKIKVQNNFWSGQIKINGAYYNSGTELFTKVGRQLTIEGYTQPYDSSTKYFLCWRLPSNNTTTVNPYTFTVTKLSGYSTQTYTAEYGDPIRIYAKNNFDGGVIKINSDTVASGTAKLCAPNESVTLTALAQEYGSYDRVWNNYAPEYSSIWKRALGSGTSDPIQNAINPGYTFNVSYNDDGYSFIADMRKNYRITRKADFTEFDDLVNQGVVAHCVEQNSTTLSAPSEQTRNNRTYRFYQWSDSNTDSARTVSAADNIEFTARYKYPTHTTNSQAMTANGSRKIVRSDDGTLHLVYGSMDRIWYERSTDNGISWKIMHGGKPLSFSDSKCPAIADNSDFTAIAYQEKDGTGSKLRLQVFYPEQDSLFRDTLFSFQDADFPSYANDMNPAIVWGDDSRCMVMMEGFFSSSSQRGVGYVGFSLGASNNFAPVGVTYGTLAGTGSARPAIFYPSYEQAVALRDTFHVAWQQTTAVGSEIKYMKLYYDSTGQLGMTNTVALPTAYCQNTYPSIISVDSSARVVWITEDPEISDSRTLQFRDPKNLSRTWYFGTNVSSPTITRQLDRSYFIGWSQPYGTGWNNYWLNNSLSSAQIFQIPDVNGRYMQMTNNGTPNNTRAVVLTGASAPYAFTTVPIIDPNVPREIVTTSVAGTVNYAEEGGVSFLFELGDVTNNSDPVSFVEADPDFYINTENDINEYLTTVPFSVNNSSDFFYSVAYSCSNPEVAALVFANGGGLLFRVELVDENTSEILAVYDSVLYCAANTGEHDNIMYQVNCQGIGTRTIRLRLQIHGYAVPEGDMMLGQMMSPIGQGGMNKLSGMSKAGQRKFWKEHGIVAKRALKEKTMTFRGEMIETENQTAVITEYSLGQNYPNPFNPATAITYSLPKDGMVTLKIYDVLGRQAAVLLNEEKPAGAYTVSFNAASLPSGTYFYELRAGDFREVKKMILVK